MKLTFKQGLQIAASFVVMGMLFALAESNYQMMQKIVPGTTEFASMVKGIAFAIAGIIIIIYFKQMWVKVFFVLLDVGIIFSFQYFQDSMWKEIGAFIYAPYTGLILFFMGKMLTDYYNEVQKREETDEKQSVSFDIHQDTLYILEDTKKKLDESNRLLRVSEIKAAITNIKKGRSPDKEAKIAELENELSNLNF